jgi:hypothetical protein
MLMKKDRDNGQLTKTWVHPPSGHVQESMHATLPSQPSARLARPCMPMKSRAECVDAQGLSQEPQQTSQAKRAETRKQKSGLFPFIYMVLHTNRTSLCQSLYTQGCTHKFNTSFDKFEATCILCIFLYIYRQ